MSYNSLFAYDWSNDRQPPIILFDYKVIAYQIEHQVNRELKHRLLDARILKLLIKANWVVRLNQGIPYMDFPLGFIGIVCSDYKAPVSVGATSGEGYWRHSLAFSEGLPEYKGGRKSSTPLFSMILEIGEEYVKKSNQFNFFSEPGFEADDFAGLATRIKKQLPITDKALYLFTVDTDWHQLVDNDHQITWCNQMPWNDLIRGNAEVLDYHYRKHRVELEHPKDVVGLKSKEGDKTDNLPPDSPVRMIDLLNEDQEYRISEIAKVKLKKAMMREARSDRPDYLDQAKCFLASEGFLIPDMQKPTPEQYLAWEKKQVSP